MPSRLTRGRGYRNFRNNTILNGRTPTFVCKLSPKACKTRTYKGARAPHTHTHAHTHTAYIVHMHMYTHMHTHIYTVHMHMYTHMHTHIYTVHMHMYKHNTCAQSIHMYMYAHSESTHGYVKAVLMSNTTDFFVVGSVP